MRRCFFNAVPGVLALLVAACTPADDVTTETPTETPTGTARQDGVAWAVNVGGAAYTAVDGTRYEAENSVSGGEPGELAAVKGSQDPALYHGYREGGITVERAIANGRYDVTLHFAEPAQVAGGERVFDVLIEDATAVSGLDVMASRDGKTESALTVTVPGVEIADGTFDLAFRPRAGQPVLNALLVREPQPAAGERELLWADEFDYEGLPDPERWNIDVWPARVVNDEDQAYTDRPENLDVRDGLLTITARREDYGDARYTSGRIHSRAKGDVHYGRVEVRARLPAGMGTWPAIWMLPSDPFRYATRCGPGDLWQGSASCDAWPNSGEIDIMEHVGYEMGHVHATVHTEAYYWAKWEQRKGRVLLDDVDRAFHVYALEWTPGRIDMFVDDTLYFTYVNEGDGWRSWPFDHPFHVILNVAVGGMWGRAGGGIDDSVFPQSLEIDYVRVYAPLAE